VPRWRVENYCAVGAKIKNIKLFLFKILYFFVDFVVFCCFCLINSPGGD